MPKVYLICIPKVSRASKSAGCGEVLKSRVEQEKILLCSALKLREKKDTAQV